MLTSAISTDSVCCLTASVSQTDSLSDLRNLIVVVWKISDDGRFVVFI